MLNLSAVDLNKAIRIDVDENTVRQLGLVGQAGGISALADFSLSVYKYDEIDQVWKIYRTEESWLEVYLLGGVSEQLDLTLGEGKYALFLSGEAGIDLLTGYTLKIVSDVIYDYNHPVDASGEYRGNVITDIDVHHGSDNVPEGTVIASVNGTDVAAVGYTEIDGLFGTLSIQANGQYVYTLKPGFTGNYGAVDEFTYTIKTPNGSYDTGHLRLTLTMGEGDTFVASDDTVVLSVTPTMTELTGTDQSIDTKSNFTVLELGLLNPILDANALAFQNAMSFTVSENTVRELTFDAYSAGVQIGGSYDLIIYKLDALTGQYVQYHMQDDWFRVIALVGTADALTLRFTEGEYKVLLAGTQAVGLLSGSELRVDKDVLYDYNAPQSLTGTTQGDITTDDHAGDVVKSVNGFILNESGSTTIVGDYGTLLINRDGTYTYTVMAGQSGSTPPYGKVETFSYVTISPNGQASVSTLRINIDMVEANALEADISLAMKNAVETISVGSPSDRVNENLSETYSFTIDENTRVSATLTLGAVLDVGNSLNHIISTYTLINKTTGETVKTSTKDDRKDASQSWDFGELAPGDYELVVTVTRPTAYIYTWSVNLAVNVTHLDQYAFDGTQASLPQVQGSFGVADLISTKALSYITVEGKSVFTQGNIGAASVDIQGQYGTLTINKDGTYIYKANGSGYGVEVFDYTLTSVAGTSSTSQLVINVGANLSGTAYDDTAYSSAADDVFTLGNGADTLVYDANDQGHGTDVWKDFNLANGDKISLSGWLTDMTIDNINDYVDVRQVFNTSTGQTDTVIAVDADGAGTNYQDLLRLENVQLTLDDLKYGMLGIDAQQTMLMSASRMLFATDQSDDLENLLGGGADDGSDATGLDNTGMSSNADDTTNSGLSLPSVEYLVDNPLDDDEINENSSII
ncbi:type I secretion C-terminal target domain-containing protein [Daeguia caeni]|uniref:Type I secretion C-terminal target domain-containing protein n=1 Tax=Daeguia caeni TaxID=439612 RepID=A0ABV9H2L2_9HYPH